MHPGTMLTDAIRQWPSPTARDYKDSPGMATEATNPDGSIRKRDDQLARAAHLWNTPRAAEGEGGLRQPDGRRSLGLNTQADLWRTPDAPNAGGVRNRQQSRGNGHQLTIAEQAEHWQPAEREFWPTPAATPYGSSQNGINGKGGECERPSANTPSLERLSHSFRPDLLPSMSGDESLRSDPTSRPQSKAKLNANFVEWLMGLPMFQTQISSE